MPSSPYRPNGSIATGGAGDVIALASTARVLREVARYEQRTDVWRGEISAAQAALLDVIARRIPELPADVTSEALRVAAAVDQATGRRAASTGGAVGAPA